MRRLHPLVRLPWRYHFFGSLAIVIFTSLVMLVRISDRTEFASSELYQGVTERWGAPIAQPAPSVRYVESGSIFTSLEALPLARQRVAVDAEMSYRKRGLVYFSGFAFSFDGDFQIVNDRGKSIDVVFVFPLQMVKNQVLLSDLTFRVDGEPASIELDDDSHRLTWTGRLADGQAVDLDIAFSAQGLDQFVYSLDPALPVRDFAFDMRVTGGDNYDYPSGVLPAHSFEVAGSEVVLGWRYDSLEAGVDVGAILPSERAYDRVLAIIVLRSWAPFLAFFAAFVVWCRVYRARARWYESYLMAATYAFFSVLLPYLTAYMNFWLAFTLSLAIIGGLLWMYLGKVIDPRIRPQVLVAVAACLFLPSLAVVLRGHTGLIYTLELLAGLALLLWVVGRPDIRRMIDDLTRAPEHTPEIPHVA